MDCCDTKVDEIGKIFSPHQFRRPLTCSARHSPQGEAFAQPTSDPVPRVFIFEDKQCEESLGLEKLAVGRNGLLPLRGTANSASG